MDRLKSIRYNRILVLAFWLTNQNIHTKVLLKSEYLIISQAIDLFMIG